MTTFYIVRHGETEWNVKKLIQGHKDSPLTLNGIKQAKNLSLNLKNIPFEAVFSSDLLRAKTTAEIIAVERTLIITTNRALRERSFGSLDGIPSITFQNKLKRLIKKRDRLDEEEKKAFRFHPEVENDEELISRVLLFLREVSLAYPRKNILIVTHSGVMRTLLVHLGFFSYSDHTIIKNASYIKLESDGVNFFVKETNGISKSE